METKSKLNRLQIGLLLLPGLCVFGVFTVYPIFRLLLMSFFDWNFGAMLRQPFIGLANYRQVMGDDTFWVVFANTVLYTLVTVPGQMALGLFTAVLIHGVTRFRVTFRVICYLPVITSWVIASLVFRYVFNTEGLLNYFLGQVLRIVPGNIRWLDTRWSGLTVAMILGIWKGVGWNMVVFLAALQQVPLDLYEAADMDGCGAARKFLHITLPGIRGTLLFALIMLTIGGFNVFTSIKMITGGKPAHQTDTLLTWMYYKAFSTGKFGYAAALSFVMAAALALLAVLQFRAMQARDAKGGIGRA
ncbi:MAG: sugar ABC transporter permease [Oscillospiraceae bacterium]|jgi:multiple sugar transport system permease protein|nr:sugar ABC transporter permease [Oscillospiraceae bacterium]